jgi:hypothetical protein
MCMGTHEQLCLHRILAAHSGCYKVFSLLEYKSGLTLVLFLDPEDVDDVFVLNVS